MDGASLVPAAGYAEIVSAYERAHGRRLPARIFTSPGTVWHSVHGSMAQCVHGSMAQCTWQHGPVCTRDSRSMYVALHGTGQSEHRMAQDRASTAWCPWHCAGPQNHTYTVQVTRTTYDTCVAQLCMWHSHIPNPNPNSSQCLIQWNQIKYSINSLSHHMLKEAA